MTKEEIELKIKSIDNEMKQNISYFYSDLLSYEEFHWLQGQCVKQKNELQKELLNLK